MQREGTDYRHELIRDDLESRIVMFAKGLGAASFDDPSQPREFDWVYRNVIVPRVKSGHVGKGDQGGCDDRKLRLHAVRRREGMVVVEIGPTDFRFHERGMSLTPDESVFLRTQGKNLFDDEYAFFARSLGVAVLPITSDGHIMVGERKLKADYGRFATVAGMLGFRGPEKLDPTVDVLRELREELTVTGDDDFEDKDVENVEFVGLSFHPVRGDGDLVYIARVRKPDRHFARAEFAEHRGFHVLGRKEVRLLLDADEFEGRLVEVVYSTRCALDCLLPEELAD